MCSCKTKKSAHLINEATEKQVYDKFVHIEALTDTSTTLRIDIDKSKLKITETIKVTEYDAESGKPTKETITEREIAQDSDKVVAEEESKGVTNCNELNEDHFADVNKMVESEVEEESIGGQEAFGKWFGIGVACAIVLTVFCILKKLRVI